MNRYKKNLGDFGEYVAADFLEAKGYEILMRNYYTTVGELDLIAQTNDWLVFVEVKTRKNMTFGRPAEAVDWKKRKHMVAAAQRYLINFPTKKEIRFDVIEIFATMVDDTPYLEHIHHIENIVVEG